MEKTNGTGRLNERVGMLTELPARRRRRGYGAALFALTGLVCIAGLTAIVLARQPAPKDVAVVQAIVAGETNAAKASGFDDDPDLASDEAAAGAMWASKNRPATPAACPDYSAAFKGGCANAVRRARK
jgi:hypothetical protein